jgi:hypothetical protein
MVSLWRSNDNPEREEQGRDGDDRPRGQYQEADERTRLLPRDQGYLSPDDPAVSCGC